MVIRSFAQFAGKSQAAHLLVMHFGGGGSAVGGDKAACYPIKLIRLNWNLAFLLARFSTFGNMNGQQTVFGIGANLIVINTGW